MIPEHLSFRFNPKRMQVRIGSRNSGSEGTVAQVSETYNHPEYTEYDEDWDVGIIILEKEMNFTDVAKPIPLTYKEPGTGTALNVTGYGRLSVSNHHDLSV